MSDKNKIVVRAYKGIILAIISFICLVILTALVLLGGAFDFEAFEFSYEDLNIAYAFYIAAGAFLVLIIAGIGLYSSSKNDSAWDDLITIDTDSIEDKRLFITEIARKNNIVLPKLFIGMLLPIIPFIIFSALQNALEDYEFKMPEPEVEVEEVTEDTINTEELDEKPELTDYHEVAVDDVEDSESTYDPFEYTNIEDEKIKELMTEMESIAEENGYQVLDFFYSEEYDDYSIMITNDYEDYRNWSGNNIYITMDLEGDVTFCSYNFYFDKELSDSSNLADAKKYVDDMSKLLELFYDAGLIKDKEYFEETKIEDTIVEDIRKEEKGWIKRKINSEMSVVYEIENVNGEYHDYEDCFEVHIYYENPEK
ncbi:hypothetical protein SAMN04487829_2386 [Pseudobutyrivibrio sp. NOR37]|uniref:Uncharacterized protein n=1 Tax=Pseudobutyrivibrio xylanivorans TaxID=185007 RepID=A0A6M0LJ70_PSEXY|nr:MULTISPECIES: hypothetical protein [Pseudobutyrivibrio]NEX02542.1 hypothetical protein [Pseudobutyrivibrio xylanivorans]SFR82534.1 hypothetical protein SAMN04487829_2386 [Pseudobutyrivibrio sp. NOR37]